MAVKIDKTLIETLENELADIVKNLKTSSNPTSALDKIVELNEKIELARNPKATLENILELVKKLYNESKSEE
jgi:hypothetical protein